MNSTSKAWLVAASIGAVEALKDQAGLCRWNYVIRLLHQHAKNYKPASASMVSDKMRLDQSEESFRKVLYLSCWGPNN